MRVFRHNVYHAAGRVYTNVFQAPSVPCPVPGVAPVPIRAIPFTRASTTNLMTATPVYRHDVYHPAGRRVVGMLYPNILQVPCVPCAVRIASPTASGVSFQTVTLGQIPSKMNRDHIYGFLTRILTIPAAEIFALRTNYHGMWFVDVSPRVASAFLDPDLPPLGYTFSKNLNYVVKGGPPVDTCPVAFDAASALQFRPQRMTLALTRFDPSIQWEPAASEEPAAAVDMTSAVIEVFAIPSVVDVECPTAPEDTYTSTLEELPSITDSDEWWPTVTSNTLSDH